MKRVPAYSLGFELTKEVASTPEEFNQLAKKDDAVLDIANDNVLYRSVFPQFRESICDYIEQATGIQRDRSGEGEDAKIVEKDAVYINRVVATIAKEENVSPESVRARWASKAQELMDKAEYNPAERERKGGGPNLVAKTYIKIAEDAHEKGVQQTVAEKLTAAGFAVTLTGDKAVDVMAIAKAISAREAQKREALKSEYGVA